MSALEPATSKAASASYRPRGYGISPGLQRARLRFRLPNIIAGTAIASFMVGVWAYSISAVKQDVFDDVDEEARALNAAAEVDERFSRFSTRIAGNDELEGKLANLPVHDVNVSNRPRGILFAALGDRHPWLFEPTRKTLVWGAPPVDNFGSLQEKIPVVWKR